MALSHWALQKAVYALLAQNVPLRQRCGVYDGIAPVDAYSPYIVLSDFSEVNANLLNRVARRVAFAVHVWSTYEGNAEVLEIAEAVVALLDQPQILQVDGWQCVLRFVEGSTFRDDVSGARHGVYRFDARLEQV